MLFRARHLNKISLGNFGKAEMLENGGKVFFCSFSQQFSLCYHLCSKYHSVIISLFVKVMEIPSNIQEIFQDWRIISSCNLPSSCTNSVSGTEVVRKSILQPPSPAITRPLKQTLWESAASLQGSIQKQILQKKKSTILLKNVYFIHPLKNLKQQREAL